MNKFLYYILITLIVLFVLSLMKSIVGLEGLIIIMATFSITYYLWGDELK